MVEVATKKINAAGEKNIICRNQPPFFSGTFINRNFRKDAYEYDPDGDYSHYYDYYEDEANVTDLARSGFGGDGEDDIFTKAGEKLSFIKNIFMYFSILLTPKKMSSYSCHNKELKPHTMVALYCKEKIVYMMKCCDVNQTLNLR